MASIFHSKQSLFSIYLLFSHHDILKLCIGLYCMPGQRPIFTRKHLALNSCCSKSGLEWKQSDLHSSYMLYRTSVYSYNATYTRCISWYACTMHMCKRTQSRTHARIHVHVHTLSYSHILMCVYEQTYMWTYVPAHLHAHM